MDSSRGSDLDDGYDYDDNQLGRNAALGRGAAAAPPPSSPPPPPLFFPAVALALAVAAAAAAAPAFAHALPPPPTPRPLPPLPSPLPPPLDACPVAAGASAADWGDVQAPAPAAAAAGAAAAAAYAAAAATARLSNLLDGGGLGRPTAASVLGYARARGAGPRPAASGALLGAAALFAIALALWRLVARLQRLFRVCSSASSLQAAGPVFPDSPLAARAAACQHRSTKSPGAVTLRLLIAAAAATACAFGILGAVRADGRLAPRLLQRADAAAELLSGLEQRGEDARLALLGASQASGELSAAVVAAGVAFDVAAAQAQAQAGAAAVAAGSPPPVVASSSVFDSAAAVASLTELSNGLSAAAGALEPVLTSVRVTMLPLLVGPPPDDGSSSSPRSRWWRLPALSPENWRPLATTLDEWRRRAEIGLFAALAAAPCFLAFFAWAGWRPGVGILTAAALWLSALAALLALALALLAVVLRDGCPAAEVIAMRFAPERLRPVLGYYFGQGAEQQLSGLPSDPNGVSLAAALQESGLLGAEAGPLLQQALATSVVGGSDNNVTLSFAATAANVIDAPLAAALATLPGSNASSSSFPAVANATATLLDARDHMVAAADAAAAELATLFAALSRDRILGPAYAAPKALICCALPATVLAAWLALTGAGAAALGAALLAGALLRRMDVAAAAAAAAGWGSGCCGCAGGGGDARGPVVVGGYGGGGGGGGGGFGGGGGRGNNVLVVREVPCAPKGRESMMMIQQQLADIQEARLERLRALDDAAEAAAAARRASYLRAPRM